MFRVSPRRWLKSVSVTALAAASCAKLTVSDSGPTDNFSVGILDAVDRAVPGVRPADANRR